MGRFGDEVNSMRTEGPAAKDAPNGEPRPAKRAMNLKCFKRVGGA